MKKQFLYIILLLLANSPALYAQEVADDFLSQTGKIYVVASLLVVTLVVLFIYMFVLDRKISRLESFQSEEEH